MHCEPRPANAVVAMKPADMRPSLLCILSHALWPAQVVGMSKLRTKYESHEAKRALCAAYDLFLADERIIPVLPKLLGTLQSSSLATVFIPARTYFAVAKVCTCQAKLSEAPGCCRQGLLQEKEAAHPSRPHQKGLGAPDCARMPSNLHVSHRRHLHQHQVLYWALSMSASKAICY